MRDSKNDLEEQLDARIKKMEIIDEILDSKDKEIYEKSNKIETLIEDNAQNIILIKTQESKIALLTEKLTSQLDICDKKYKKLKDEKDFIEKEYNEFATVKKAL